MRVLRPGNPSEERAGSNDEVQNRVRCSRDFPFAVERHNSGIFYLEPERSLPKAEARVFAPGVAPQRPAGGMFRPTIEARARL
jgi:hypothetical protein